MGAAGAGIVQPFSSLYCSYHLACRQPCKTCCATAVYLPQQHAKAVDVRFGRVHPCCDSGGALPADRIRVAHLLVGCWDSFVRSAQPTANLGRKTPLYTLSHQLYIGLFAFMPEHVLFKSPLFLRLTLLSLLRPFLYSTQLTL